MLKTRTKKVIDVQDWNKLVRETYGKTYNFQQQEGCKDRGTVDLIVPYEYTNDELMNDSIPELINGEEMGVKFKVWLERSPDAPLNPTSQELKSSSYYWGKTEEDEESYKTSKSHINMFWERNFYPDVNELANDMYKKGVLEAGEYLIDIDW